MKNKRYTSFELLRIIAMIMIIFHHFFIHGNFNYSTTSITIERLYYNLMIGGGKIGVNIFILLSGYFLSDQEESKTRVKKILKLLSAVYFYSIIFLLTFKTFSNINISSIDYLTSLFPITFSNWWFVSTYFVLYLLHPFLNKLIDSLQKEDFQKLLIFSIITWSLIPTLTNLDFQGNDLLWFMTLYMIAAYIRKYDLNKKVKKSHYIKLLILITLLTYSSTLIFSILGRKYLFFRNHVFYFYDQNKLPILIISVCLFMVFKLSNIKYTASINKIASATFGVYLIHDNLFTRRFLWNQLFNVSKYQDSVYLIPYSIFVVFIVFISASIIELLRQSIATRIIELDKHNLDDGKNLYISIRNILFGG